MRFSWRCTARWLRKRARRRIDSVSLSQRDPKVTESFRDYLNGRIDRSILWPSRKGYCSGLSSDPLLASFGSSTPTQLPRSSQSNPPHSKRCASTARRKRSRPLALPTMPGFAPPRELMLCVFARRDETNPNPKLPFATTSTTHSIYLYVMTM